MQEHDENAGELNRLVRENSELVRENNRLLKKMRRAAIIGTVFKILSFAVIIGVPVFLYFYAIEPYIDGFRESYEEFRGDVGGFSDFRGIEDILRNFQ